MHALEKFSPIHMHPVLGSISFFIAFSERYSMKEVPGAL